MTKQVIYVYLGTNGTIESPVHLEDIYYIRKVRLMADANCTLTNGKDYRLIVTVPEDETDSWKEIPLSGED
jgi:thiamine monophosphate kinase